VLDSPEEEERLVKRFRKDNLTLNIFEHSDKSGTVRYWTLSRELPEGENPLMVAGTVSELPHAKALLVHAELFLAPRKEVASEREKSNGKYVVWGLWFERESGPSKQQEVKIESRGDGQSNFDAKRVTPLDGAITPGELDKPVYVVIELEQKNACRGRIVDFAPDSAQAAAQATRLDKLHQEKEYMLDAQRNTLSLMQ
jgi:hypothetical protein